MFSGIIEAKSRVCDFVQRDQVAELHIEKPEEFNDIKLGDSVANNGVCLTVESQTPSSLVFVVAHETLKVTGWTEQYLRSRPINLERSLKIGDRVHGHFVTGHVDAVGELKSAQKLGENLILTVSFPDELEAYIWKKGSVSLNGVSLTVNEVGEKTLSVCLIPETQKRTNLGDLQVGDPINVEVDFMARGLIHSFQQKSQEAQR